MKSYLTALLIFFSSFSVFADNITNEVYVCYPEQYINDRLNLLSVNDDYIIQVLNEVTDESKALNGKFINELPKEYKDVLYEEIDKITFKISFVRDLIILKNKAGKKFEFKNLNMYELESFESRTIDGFLDYDNGGIDWNKLNRNIYDDKNYQWQFEGILHDIKYGTTLNFGKELEKYRLKLFNLGHIFMGIDSVDGRNFNMLLSNCKVDEF